MRIVVTCGLLLLLAIGGCSSPYQRTLYTDFILFTVYEPRIVHGKTTEEEIRQWFGPPWSVTREFLGNRVKFTYLFSDEPFSMDVVLQNGIVIGHDFTSRIRGGRE